MSAIIKLSAPAAHGYWEIPVLYEDDHLMALDKPACLLTSPDRYDPNRPNLMKLLHGAITRKAPWVVERGLTYLANAHRLDFETTGIILLAKNKPALIGLANQFGCDKPHKVYIALAHGMPLDDQFEVNERIGPHPNNPAYMRIDRKHGKVSFTRFEVMERFCGYALIKCLPRTGRTHQIRVHLRSMGLPLVGDAMYGGELLLLSRLKRNYRVGKNGERPLLDRTALHATQLVVTHPVTGAVVEINAPWPKDLEVAVKYLRRFAPLTLDVLPPPGEVPPAAGE